MEKKSRKNFVPKRKSKVDIHEDCIKEGLAYYKAGELNYAVGKLALAIQLISQQQRMGDESVRRWTEVQASINAQG